MGDLDDQLRRLADRRAGRTPATDASTARRAGSGPTGGGWWLAAAAVFALVAGTAVWAVARDDDPGADVAGSTTTDPPPSSTAPDPSTTSSSTTSTTPESTGMSATADYDLVAATEDGIDLRRTGTHEVDHVDAVGLTGARIAFVLAGPVLVYESGLSGLPTAQIVVATPTAQEVVLDGGVRLLDAATVDGVPTALFTRRTGDTPETADERLVLFDLSTSTETDLGRFGGWESGVADARFGDGAIVAHMAAEGFEWLEAVDYTGEPLWSTEEEFDPSRSLAIEGQNVFLLAVDALGADSMTMRWQLLDLMTGDDLGGFERTGRAETVVLGGAVSCERPTWRVLVWCNRGSDAAPFQLDLELGIVDPVPGLAEGLVTQVRAVSATAPPRHPCGRGSDYFSGPDDVISSTPIDLPDGATLRVDLWNEDDRVIVQGFLPDWATNRLDVGQYIHEFSRHIDVTPADAANEGFPDGLGGAFTVFLPDAAFTEETRTGFLTWVEFDGCELSLGVSGVVN